MRSHRVGGAAHASFRTKRLTQKARPLTAAEVRTFELGVTQAACPCDRYFCGFITWLVYTRTRFSDSARMEEPPVLDVDCFGADAFGEAEAGLTKTGNMGRRFRMALPVVAHAVGITGTPWLRHWLSLRSELLL
eukprot:4314310-Lingulodinium_polyedra.AAC.1